MILQLLQIILEVVAPVAICAAIGFVWVRQDRPYDTAMVTTLVTNIGVPCLVFSALVKANMDPASFAEMGAATLVTNILFFALGWAVLKALGMSIRTFLNPVVFGNTGNMGLPLSLLAFGEAGLAFGITYFVVNVILLVTVGIAVASGSYRPLDAFKQPFIYAVGLAVFFMLSGFPVPKIALSTTALLGNFAIPLMLITLGVSLAKLQIVGLGRACLISFLRIGLGIAVGFAVAHLFGMQGAARGVLILECAMPVAVMTFLLAERYGADGKEVAGAVVISTAFSFLSMPALLWFLRL
ncbi:MAG: AEC family transporter [Proteobacteria bacterium]|nr:AEC family transporter [Pseudomonadota bacterium]